MAQTTNPFVASPVVNIEVTKGGRTNFDIKLLPGKDIHEIFDVESAGGCPCMQDILTFNDRIKITYQDSHSNKHFEEKGNPAFFFIEKYITIWYKKEGIEPKIVNNFGVEVINNLLPWESILVKIKVKRD